jgi:hypothetical protein
MIVSTRIESNGHPRITTPAIEVMIPPRCPSAPGQLPIVDRGHRLRDALKDDPDSDPDRQQQNGVGAAEVAEHKMAKTSDSASPMNSSTRPEADPGSVSAKNTWARNATSRKTPNSVAVRRIDVSDHPRTSAPTIRVNTPDTRGAFHSSGGAAGGSRQVVAELCSATAVFVIALFCHFILLGKGRMGSFFTCVRGQVGP